MNSSGKETRAQFVDESHGLPHGGKSNQNLRSALKQRRPSGEGNSDYGSLVVSSPLLNSTPPTVTKSLVKLYPYLVIADRALSTLTWTNDDVWESVLMVICYGAGVVYFERLIKFFGHLVIVGVLWGYSLLDKHVEETIRDRPTLDDVVQMMSRVVAKSDLLLSPVSVLSGNDIKRLLLTMVFLSPIYVILTLFVIPPRKFVLVAGVYVLTYHSSWSSVTRKLLWRFKLVRLLAFYVTGLDLSGVNKYQGGIFAAVHKKVKKLSGTNGADDGKPIRFTYVLYENQRRWLAIGWTSNMLSYERSSWTDEFLNEAPPPEKFKLPEENGGMVWRWVDKTWRLDLTNDGAIHLPSSRSKTTASPNSDDGFIYYDNTWKKPSTEDSFSKYTRRRRWIRTAELIKIDALGAAEGAHDELCSVTTDMGSSPSRNVKFETSTPSSPRARKVSFSKVENVRVIHASTSASDKNNTRGELSERTKKEPSPEKAGGATESVAKPQAPENDGKTDKKNV